MEPRIGWRGRARRAVSLLLALALLVGLLPGAVTAASREDLTAAQEANLAYYERNTEYVPLTALAVYALTRDRERTAQIPLNADFTGGETAYSAGGAFGLGTAEGVAAIDAMVRGEDPRKVHLLDYGFPAETASDLIGDLLSNLEEDGNFVSTVANKQIPVAASITNTYSLLALEMYYAGGNWQVAGGTQRQTRTGAIETYLESFGDAKFENTKGVLWEIPDGRVIGQTGQDLLMASKLFVQTDAALLLARWLEDETPVTVHGTTYPLKELASKELTGLLHTFEVLYGEEEGSYQGSISRMARAIKGDTILPQYISALVAAGKKEQVDALGLMDQLLRSFVTRAHIEDENNTHFTDKDLGGYFNWNDRSLPISTAGIRHGSVWRGSVALGDYLHNDAVMATFVYDPELSDGDTVAHDLDALALPATTMGQLFLPATGRFGSSIVWTSSNPAVVDPATGEVKNPAAGEPAVVVTLTAKVTFGSAEASRSFVVKVLPLGGEVQTDKAAVHDDRNAIVIPLFTTADMDLPTSGASGSAISWSSSNPAAISDAGKVTVSYSEQKVTLTATITKGEASATRTFAVTVGRIVSEDDLVTKTVYQLREYYQTHRNLTRSYWDVWMAKSVLREDFDQYGFTFYNLKEHKPGRTWAGTDIGAAILQIVAQGDNPYDYQGVNYVRRLHDYIGQGEDGKYYWGAWTEPIFLYMGLEASGSMTPELQKAAMKQCSSMMGGLAQGADYGGWTMVPMGNSIGLHPNDPEVQKYREQFDHFRQVCLDALVRDQEDDQYGFIGGHPYSGYSAAIGTNSVLIGTVSATRSGISGWDFRNGEEWTQDNGDTIVSLLYQKSVVGKEEIHTQTGIAFADLYHGSNVWVSENPTPEKLSAYIREAEGLLRESDAYTAASVAALQAALERAKAVEGEEYAFGEPYFALQQALKEMKPAGSISVTILGTADRETLLSTAPVDASGSTYLEVLQKASVEYGFSFTPTSQAIVEVSGLYAGEGAGWYLYDGQARVTDLKGKPADGAALTLKYCSDTTRLEQEATLEQHLTVDAAEALDLGDVSAVTSDLALPQSGAFGTSIVWLSDKPLVISNTGAVTRSESDVHVTLTAIVTGAAGETSIRKELVVTVKGTQENPVTTEQYAYISVVDPKGETYLEKTRYEIEAGETAYTLLKKTGLTLDVEEHSEYGVYVKAIEGWGEFSDGSMSGWMYRITHDGTTNFPGQSAALEPVSNDDYVEWLYTRDLGEDIGGGPNAEENYKAANAVEALIAAIGDPVTLESEEAIAAAREAYDQLTDAQKRLVRNYDALTAAETALAELKKTDEDQAAADRVKALIDAIGTVTLERETAIREARTAYDALTDLQKKLVSNYQKLVDAESALAYLKLPHADAAAAYQSTGDYLTALGKEYTPTVGSIGGEWMVLGLARSGREVPAGYYDNVVSYVNQKIDQQGRLHSSKSTDNSRLILALTAMGKDVTDVGGHNLLQGLTDMKYVKKQGINGPIWALIALDCHGYEVPTAPTGADPVTRQKLIEAILDGRLADGGWSISGRVSDADMTGMAIQALAPYYKTQKEVQAAVDQALQLLSKLQEPDGGFYTLDTNGSPYANSESCAQVVVALTALGLDPHTDSRFIKQGHSVLDALCSYVVAGGGFCHLTGGQRNGMATEQGYYALTAYFRLKDGKTGLYDMSDVTIQKGNQEDPTKPTDPAKPTDPSKPTDPAAPTDQPTNSNKKPNNPATGDDSPVGLYTGILILGLLAAAALAAPELKKKRAKK